MDKELIKFFMETFLDKRKHVRYISRISAKILFNATNDLPEAN